MAVTVIVGFGSAVLGGIAVFLGALYIERWRIRRTRTGVVRALIGELRQNAATVIGVLYAGRPATQYSSETWQAANFELAQFLDGELYESIVFLYTMLPAVEDFSSRPYSTKETKGLLADWLQRVAKAMTSLLQLREAGEFRPEKVEGLAQLIDATEKLKSEGEGLTDKATQSE